MRQSTDRNGDEVLFHGEEKPECKNCAAEPEAGGADRRRERRAESAQFLPCGASTIAGRAVHRENQGAKPFSLDSSTSSSMLQCSSRPPRWRARSTSPSNQSRSSLPPRPVPAPHDVRAEARARHAVAPPR
ncbi:hypothetical protein THAOC_06601, partial [Thalassiosira oceanica]